MKIDWVDQLLWEWARWAERAAANIGYPHRTVEHRLMTEGAGASIKQAFGPRIELVPDHIEVMEDAVTALPDEQKQAVMLKYLGRGTDSQKSRDMGVSRTTFNRLIEMAQSRIAGRLECLGIGNPYA